MLCREYVRTRTTDAAARRELEDLRAAINHHRREGLCSKIIEVVLPPEHPARDRWLTRSEAARLIWAAWRCREKQKGLETGPTPAPAYCAIYPGRALHRNARQRGVWRSSGANTGPWLDRPKTWRVLPTGLQAIVKPRSGSRQCRCRTACSRTYGGGNGTANGSSWNGIKRPSSGSLRHLPTQSAMQSLVLTSYRTHCATRRRPG